MAHAGARRVASHHEASGSVWVRPFRVAGRRSEGPQEVLEPRAGLTGFNDSSMQGLQRNRLARLSEHF